MISDNEAAERVARAICIADDGDPDMLVCYGQAYQVRKGHAQMTDPHPLWHHYMSLATAAIDAVEQLPPDYLERLTA